MRLFLGLSPENFDSGFVIINTYNGALHLPEVLDALKGFDEVVVCDMESTDDTVPKRLRKRYGMGAMLFRPLWFFIKSYVLKGGVRDGRRGIVRAYMESMYQMVLLAKVTESQLNHDNKI